MDLVLWKHCLCPHASVASDELRAALCSLRQHGLAIGIRREQWLREKGEGLCMAIALGFRCRAMPQGGLAHHLEV